MYLFLLFLFLATTTLSGGSSWLGAPLSGTTWAGATGLGTWVSETFFVLPGAAMMMVQDGLRERAGWRWVLRVEIGGLALSELYLFFFLNVYRNYLIFYCS